MNRFVKAAIALALAPVVISVSSSAIAAAENAANATPAVQVSDAEKAKIESVVHDYLLKNPNVIVEAIQMLQKKQYEDAEKAMKQTQVDAPKFVDALFRQANDPVLGNKNGKITVVEFFDYQCPHCVDMAPVIEAIVKNSPNVRVVMKEFPIRGEMSDFAARAALAANKQGKYFPLHEAMLTTKTPLTKESIIAMAKKVGLNVSQLEKDMDSSEVKEQLKNNLKLAQDLKLFGIPAFFIGKSDATTTSSIQYVPGQMNLKQMQDAIQKSS